MYTMVLMMAMSTSGDAASFGKKSSCHGCTGAVVVSSCYGSCTGYTTGYTSCTGCTGYTSCHGSCHGKSGFLGGFLGKKNSCHGSSCHGSSCYGSCYGVTTGCWGSTGCVGTVVVPTTPTPPVTMPKETPKETPKDTPKVN